MTDIKENITEEQYNNYAQTYSKFGSVLVDLPINNNLPNVVAQFLPNDYRAADLGSNDGIFAEELERICQKLNKKGTCWSIDPYPTNSRVLKMTSQQFVNNSQFGNLDLVLCKYSIHFNQNQTSFFQNVYHRLKNSGKFVILQIGSNFELPWTQKVQNKFKELYLKAADIIPSDLFDYELENQQKKIQIDRTFFKQFIRRRGWSNLLSNSQEQIDECLTKLDSMKQTLLPIKTCIWKYTLTKKSKINQ